MKISEQIRARREQLGVSIHELAKRVGVSQQAVRHWESGRSFPGKSKAPALEEALTFRLDWTEGVKSRLERPEVAELLDKEDIDILLVIRKLPESVKKIVLDFAEAYLDALDGRAAFRDRILEASSGGSFQVRESATGKIVTVSESNTKKSPARKHHPARKRVA